MLIDFVKMDYIIGTEEILAGMDHVPAMNPFNNKIIEYLDHVSKILLSSPEAKKFSDVITFGFWCRKASVIHISRRYEAAINRIGRGIVFHIAPSNVAVNFAYSLAAGLLSGNANIVRLPSREFEQTGIICKAMEKALTEEIKPYLCLLQYGHEQNINDILSAICDTRIIWGGDETINTIRRSPLKPRATEITFADRFSLCVIQADKYLEADNKNSIARGFYNDTYLSDQNACTSPKLVIWMGTGVKQAQTEFWNELYRIVEMEYPLLPVQAVSKYANMCRVAAFHNKVHRNKDMDNHIVLIKTEKLTYDLVEYFGNCGFFIEYEAKALCELMPVLSSRCQTLSYYGFDVTELSNFIITNAPKGVDRIIPIGKTMDFSLIWDGYDLIYALSREISYL